MINRRSVLTGGLVAAGGTLVPPLARFAVAELALPSGRLTTVSDGHLVLPESFVLGDLPREEASALLAAAGLSADGLEAPCNLALWQSEAHVVLFDAGSGPGFMPSAGRIAESLAAIDLAPEDVTHVVFTHGHPDHLWGAVDDFDEPFFADARHYIGAAEAEYWTDPATIESLGAARQSFAAGALRRIEILGDGLTRIGGGDEIVPGLAALDLPGHTPGHMGLRLRAGDTSALIVGDAIGNGHLALLRPDWPSPADHDPEQGRATRTALLEELAASGETMVGFHLPEGGMGRITPAEEGYAFSPA
ncbi:MBL fold metallo-hydrolase [Roseivivax sp. CAU 1761]